MIFKTTYLAVLALALVAQTAAGLGVNETCNGIAGPIYGDCDTGLTCCAVEGTADLSTCQRSCGKPPLGEGETCSGIAGPIYGDCAKGLICCPKPMTADWSTCEKKCKKVGGGEPPKPPLPHGATCSGFAGPIYGDCAKPLVCCAVKFTADLSTCMTKLECAKQ